MMPTVKAPEWLLPRFNSGAITVSVSDAEQAPVAALKELPAAVQATPGLATPAGGVTDAVLVTVVCANSDPAANRNTVETMQRRSRRPIFDALQQDV